MSQPFHRNKYFGSTCLLMAALILCFAFAPTHAQAQASRELLQLGRGTANALDWRPDGQVGAKAIQAGIQLYDVDYQKTTILPIMEMREGELHSLEWSPNGDFLAVDVGIYLPNTEPQYMIYIWEISVDGKTAENRMVIPDEGYGSHLSWKPHSSHIAVDGRVFDAKTGEIVFIHQYARADFNVQTGATDYSERNREGVSGIYWSPDGERFASIHYGISQSSASSYAIFAANTDELLVELEDGRTDPGFPRFVWSPDGSKITDNYGRSWEAPTGNILASIRDSDLYSDIGETQSIWNTDNKTIFTLSTWRGKIGRPPSALFFWDAATGEFIYKQSFWREVNSLRWEKDKMTAQSIDGYELTFDNITGEAINAEHISDTLNFNALAWSPDSTKLVGIAPGPPNYPMQLWDVGAIRSGGEIRPLWTVHDDWFEYEADANQYAPNWAKVMWNKDEIVTVSKDYYVSRTFHSVERWNALTGESQGRVYFSEGDFMPPMAEPSPDLRLLAAFNTYWYTVNSEEIHPIEISALDAQQQILTLNTSNGDILTWSPDSQFLATLGLNSGITEIWDINEQGVELTTTLNANGETIDWSPDGSLIAVGDKIYDPASGQLISQLAFETPYRYWVEWSPNNRILAMFSYGSTQITFYDVYTGEAIEIVEADDIVSALAWSPNGTMLALGMNDGTIRIWDVSDISEN